MNGKILVVDDDSDLQEVISLKLSTAGYQVFSAANGKEALRVLYEKRPDLVVLDIDIPEMNGWQLCQRLRDFCSVPVLVLTGQVGDRDAEQAFELGAADYLKKPCSLRELEFRIRAILKRLYGQQFTIRPVYDDGTLHIDLVQREVYRNGEKVNLTGNEFRLLHSLIKHSGMAIPHQQLMVDAWGTASSEGLATLSVYIRYLREKLEPNPRQPRYIRTRWGYGYWFAPARA